jgi:D-alanyl-D-alanine carboxypeptidase/D-alanyl-D-alanine-endopeptidase (penicillin-binding protein 4)
MVDGSGLSRYNYLTADAVCTVLRRVWMDERLRGPFVAALPVAGHDGTLEVRMRNSALQRRVQAKTGTITNVRSLAGYVETPAGEKLAFAIIANNFTTAAANVDAIAERALARLVDPSGGR